VDISSRAGLRPAGSGFAAVIPKRHARRSVTRNLIRRQMREAVRFQRRIGPEAQVLIRLRAPFDPRRFTSAASAPLRLAVRAELDLLFSRPGLGAAP
jgi:ribonuclease P protein component